MNKKQFTGADIGTKFITPAILGPDGSKWDKMTQLLEEHFFTKGRVIVRGKSVKRAKAKKADYILSYKPDLPFAYSSNGDAFLEHGRTKPPIRFNPVHRSASNTSHLYPLAPPSHSHYPVNHSRFCRARKFRILVKSKYPSF